MYRDISLTLTMCVRIKAVPRIREFKTVVFGGDGFIAYFKDSNTNTYYAATADMAPLWIMVMKLSPSRK